MATNFFENKPFTKLGLFAIPLLICMMAMGSQFPKGEVLGFSSKVIAFEFATSTGDIQAILAPLSEAERMGMDRGNYIDFAFMLTYASFIFFFFKVAKQQFKIKWLVVGQVLAVIILLGDVLENIQLLNITRTYANDPNDLNIAAFLFQLQLFTWLKWLCLGLALLLASFALVHAKGFIKNIALLFSVPFLLSMIALINGTPTWIERFTISIFLGLGSLVLVCFFVKRQVT